MGQQNQKKKQEEETLIYVHILLLILFNALFSPLIGSMRALPSIGKTLRGKTLDKPCRYYTRVPHAKHLVISPSSIQISLPFKPLLPSPRRSHLFLFPCP